MERSKTSRELHVLHVHYTLELDNLHDDIEVDQLELDCGRTHFHPIVNATKQVAEETRKELAPMKKALTDIDGALIAQRFETHSKTPLNRNTDICFGFHRKQDG